MTLPLVLVVDDEKPLRNFIRRNLEARQFEVITASNGLEALAQLNTNPVRFVILDVMMPRMDGLETLRRIRQQSNIPVVMLSALGEEKDIIQALHLGADDYLTKPFGVRELMARVHAVLRRAGRQEVEERSQSVLVRNAIVADLEKYKLTVNNLPVEVTATEFKLLILLMENSGKVLSHREILQHVWGPKYGDENEYLRVYIGRLRQKIETDPRKPKYLKTVRGIGYTLEA